MAKQPDPGPYRAIPCPCSSATCENWLVEPIAAIQGVSFTRSQAEFVAAVLNLAAVNGEKILSTEFLTDALKAMSERDRGTPWRPIATAPRSAGSPAVHCVLVRGPSQMRGVKHFVVLAYHDDHYRPLDPWRLIDNSALSDFSWVPEEWMEIPE